MEDFKTYLIGQVCEILNVENFNLRYIEKVLDLSIKRNEAGERIYSNNDVEIFKMIFELKQQGLNYKAIKKVLEHQGELAFCKEEREEKVIIRNDNIDYLMCFFKEAIDESIEEKVNSKLEIIINNLFSILKQNEELKIALKKEQERHFIELDRKLIKCREMQQERQDKLRKELENKKKKSWFKKIDKKNANEGV